MDLMTCLKFAQYLTHECDRCLRESDIDDDQISRLAMETERFQTDCLLSDLPAELKERIASIHLEYDPDQFSWDTVWIIIAVFTVGIWGIALFYLRQERRKSAILSLRGQFEGIPMFIRLNYPEVDN